MKMRLRILILSAFALLVPLNSWAQQVYWTPSSGSLQQGKSNRLQLHFEGCEPDGDVALPSQTGADFTLVGRTSSMNMSGARVVQKMILEYQVSPNQQGTLTIPAFNVNTNRGVLPVAEVQFEVTEATVGNTGMKPEDIFKSELSVLEDSIYEGEIFTLRYVLGFRQDYQNRVSEFSPPQWSPVGVVTNGFEEYRTTTFSYRNHNYTALLFESPAMATRSGIVKLPKVNQSVSMVVGRRRGFIFDDPVVDSFNVPSETLELEIKPLPPGEPTSFTGAVGQFQFESTVVPEIVQVGEPVTWTLKLSGTGNWPQGFGINPRNVSSTFRSIQPDVNKEISEDSPFDGSLSEDIVLIPTQSGDFQFGPTEFSFFNPKSDRYETISIPAKTIVVNPLVTQDNPPSPTQPALTPASPAGTSDSSGLGFELDPVGVNLLSKPIELLSSPSESNQVATIPEGRVSFSYLALSFAAPALLWALIALVRSVIYDPNKRRRNAFRALKAASLSLDDSESGAKAAQLDWRVAAKEYWEIRSEEPSFEDVAHAVSKYSDNEQAARWKTLWQNSDRMLFGKKAPPFKEWQSELRDLLGQIRQPGISLRRFFSHKAWFAVIALTLCLIGVDTSVGDGLKSYNQGDFAAAQTAWESELEANPANWSARHNLGLASAQQENWGNAMAYWTSAFLLDTRAPELRWNLKVALSKSGGYYPTLGRLVKGDGMMAYVSLLTPAQWERVAYLSMLCAGVAFCAWVALLYLRGQKRPRFVLAVIGVLAVAAVFVADWARGEYGLLANPEAIVVTQDETLKSVPTDLEVEQIESPLPEGSVGIVVKRFLGWLKIELPNGEQGWARQESFAPLYGPIDRSL